jgi:hypothetical protein
MILDDPGLEVAYGILAFVAWVWALSQLRAALIKPTEWRVVTVLWMATKAGFFTYAGSIWWTNELNTTALKYAVYTLAITHVIAFIAWLRIPPERTQVLDRPPLVDPKGY